MRSTTASIVLRPTFSVPLIALAAFAALLLSTRLGIGVGADSTAYLGFRPHDVGHAPLYSWLMRLGGQLPGDVTLVARLYHAVLYAGTAALVWCLVHRATDRPLAAWAGAALVAFSGQALGLYSVALSEPTFVVLLVIAFWCLSTWVDTRAPRWFVGAAAAAALATLARYPGAALVATGALTVLVGGGGPLLRRLGRAAAFGTIGLLPAVAWMSYVAAASGTAGGRQAGFAGTATGETFYRGSLEAARYVLPTEFPVALRLAALAAALLLVAAATVAFYRRAAPRSSEAPAPQRHRYLPLILAAFVLAYVGVVVLGVLVEPFLPISGRYLYPAFVAIVLLGATTLPALARPAPARRALALGVAAFAALSVVRTAKVGADGYEQGWDYASQAWRSSPTVAYVNALPATAAVYTDDPYALLYLTHRSDVANVPAKVVRRLGKPNPDFEKQLDAMRLRLQSTGGVVVIFDRDRGEFVQPVLPELSKAMPLREQVRFADATVYALSTQDTTRVAGGY